MTLAIMPRGCVLSIITACVLMLIGSIIFFLFRWPDVQRVGTSRTIYVIERAMEDYKEDFGDYPDGENGRIAGLLLGDNPREKPYLSKKEVVLRRGQFVDFWKRPLRFGVPDDKPHGLSAGRNGRFGDSDDISSQLVREMIRQQREENSGES